MSYLSLSLSMMPKRSNKQASSYKDQVRPSLTGMDPLPLKTSNFLQFLSRIVIHGIYLILCGFSECFKTIGFFKMPSVSYLDKNRRILEDSMGGNPLPSLTTPTTASRWIFLTAMNAKSPNLTQKSISPKRTSTALKEVPPPPKWSIFVIFSWSCIWVLAYSPFGCWENVGKWWN